MPPSRRKIPRTSRVRLLAVLLPRVASSLLVPSSPPQRSIAIVFTLGPEREFQSIHGFAASDASSIRFLGGHGPAAQRVRAADLLFGTRARPVGPPEGIKLSEYPVEIGAGSATPGDSSKVTDRWRSATRVMQPDGSYDWSWQTGRGASTREAQAPGVSARILA